MIDNGGGVLPAGAVLSWEIDEPGFGDIFDHLEFNDPAVAGSELDNMNSVLPAAFPFGDDVSMAIGFDFVLEAAETAVATFFLDIANGAPGFFLNHRDPDSLFDEDMVPKMNDPPNELFFWASLDIQGDGPGPIQVPEPGSLALFGMGVAGMGLMRRRRKI